MHLGGMIGADGMGGAGAAAGGDNFDMYGGIDPTMDPELAMAIRASTEEARAQEEARVRAQQEASAAEGGAAAPAASSSSSSGNLLFLGSTSCGIARFTSMGEFMLR
jgi:26S proteasome regulatory subunit N10